MDTALWIVQVILALMFVVVGVTKVRRPKEKLAERMPWVGDFSAGQVRWIGLLEILGALALILPGATGILPWLTPLVAVGLALTMLVAGIVHWRRKEYGNIVVNAVLLLRRCLSPTVDSWPFLFDQTVRYGIP